MDESRISDDSQQRNQREGGDQRRRARQGEHKFKSAEKEPRNKSDEEKQLEHKFVQWHNNSARQAHVLPSGLHLAPWLSVVTIAKLSASMWAEKPRGSTASRWSTGDISTDGKPAACGIWLIGAVRRSVHRSWPSMRRADGGQAKRPARPSENYWLKEYDAFLHRDARMP